MAKEEEPPPDMGVSRGPAKPAITDEEMDELVARITGWGDYARMVKSWVGWTKNTARKVNGMSDVVKAALIICIALVAGVSVWTYFSPYHTCVRDLHDRGFQGSPEGRCATAIGRGR